MKCAKYGYILENGLVLNSGDIIKITTNNGDVGIGRIIDIEINEVTIRLENGCLMSVLFKDVEDIKKMKNALDNIVFESN